MVEVLAAICQVPTPAAVVASDWIFVVLIGIGFLAGIGITALGPGGVFVTIALYTLAGIGPAAVAGTASATNIAAGLLDSIAYTRSGELLAPQNQRLALVVSTTSVLGASLELK